MKGMTYYYISSQIANTDVEVPPDLFYMHLQRFTITRIDYSNGDVRMYGYDELGDDSKENYIGGVIITQEEKECGKNMTSKEQTETSTDSQQK